MKIFQLGISDDDEQSSHDQILTTLPRGGSGLAKSEGAFRTDRVIGRDGYHVTW